MSTLAYRIAADPSRVVLYAGFLDEAIAHNAHGVYSYATVHRDAVRSRVGQVPTIDVTDAIEYFYQREKDDAWAIADFPTVRLPFEECFLETRHVRGMGFTDGPTEEVRELQPGTHQRQMAQAMGIYVTEFAVGAEYWANPGWTTIVRSGWTAETRRDIAARARRVQMASIVFEDREVDTCIVAGALVAPLTDDGAPVSAGLMLLFLPNVLLAGEARAAMRSIFQGVQWSVFFALSLMHCKNVVATPHDAPRQMRRARERANLPPLEKHYTLDIRPMRQVLRDEGGAERTGLKKALHICRGHFSTYTPDRPLFGRHVGRYWIPAHARGSADVGRVHKDYRVKP